ncbi:MAG: DUF6427 family protein [Bacteroidota bacterium]
MIIGKFKNNHPFTLTLLVIVALALWLDGFFLHQHTSLPQANHAPLYTLLVGFFEQNTLLSVVLSFLFMIAQAFMFNAIVTDKNLVERNSKLPALMYIVLMSSSFNLFGMHPVWFANFFMLIALSKMFEVFREEAVFIEIFNVGFFISLASLFYFPALSLILLFIASLIIYYLVNLRALLASLIGLGLPYIFVALYYYWFNRLQEQWDTFARLPFDAGLSSMQFVPFGWVSIIIIGFIGIIAITRLYLGTLRDKPIRIRRRYNVLLVYLLISIASVAFAGKHTIFHHGIIMLPLAGILAGFFQVNNRKMANEILFTILLLLIVVGKLARLD